jgi:RNA polymerase sigma factor (sigma-70 family)
MDGRQVDSFDEFVRHNLPALARYAHVLTGSRHAAEDLLQDTLLRVTSAWPRVREDGHPLGYTRTAMVRLHVSRLRRLRRQWQTTGAHATEYAAERAGGAEDAGLVRVEQQELLRPALQSLSPLQRAVVVLTYFDDADDQTIARVVKRRRATVRSVRHRALRVLRARLDSSPAAAAKTTETTERRP